VRLALLTALGLWVLAAHTYGEFTRVRDIVVRDPAVARPAVRIPLTSVAGISDPYVVLIFRARNDADMPLTVTARVGNEELGQSTIPPRSSRRVDLSWPKGRTRTARDLELHGDRAGWTLEAAEVANVHGFTRGAVNFVVLPSPQPFGGAPLWLWLAGLACAVLAHIHRPVRWSRWPAIAHYTLTGVIVILFVAAVMSPLVSGYRIVLAAHTVALGFAILGAWGLWRLTSLVAGRIGIQAQRAGLALTRWSRAVLQPSVARAMRVAAIVPWFTLVALAATTVYVSFLWPNMGMFAGGADSAGYLGSARLLLEGRVRAPLRALPAAEAGTVEPLIYMPLGFRTVGSYDMAPSYPVGLPLLVAAAPAVELETKAAIAMAAHAVAGALLVFWLALECGLSRYAAALAALLVATSPVYVFMSLTLMSDVPAMVWTTAAVMTMWRSRKDARWALAAGAAISMAVLIRPTNALGFVPIAACAGLSLQRWLLLAAGGLPGAALFFGYNLGAYGSAMASGYVGVDIHFGAKHIVPSLRHYAVWLPAMLTPIVVLVLGLPALRRTSRLATVLMLWIAAYLGLYTVYSYTYEAWWYTRFLVPAFPPLAVGALWVGRTALDWLAHAVAPAAFTRTGGKVASAVGAIVLAAAALAHNVRWSGQLGVVAPNPHESQYMSVARWVRTHLPAGSGILSMQMSGSLYHYTSFGIVRWDYIDGDILRRLERDSTAGRHPLYAVLHPVDYSLEVRERVQGHWTQVAAIEGVDVWRFDRLPEGVGSLPADERWLPLTSDH
jgi:hypothetical protein